MNPQSIIPNLYLNLSAFKLNLFTTCRNPFPPTGVGGRECTPVFSISFSPSVPLTYPHYPETHRMDSDISRRAALKTVGVGVAGAFLAAGSKAQADEETSPVKINGNI